MKREPQTPLAATASSDERFRLIFEQAAVGVALTDQQTGRYLKVNQKYCEIVGYSAEELLGMRFQDLTHPDDLPTDLDQAQGLLQRQISSFTREKRYLHKNGEVIWGSLSVSSFRDDDAALYLNVAILQDITARKQAETHRDLLDALVQERTAELEGQNAQLEVQIAERKRAEEALSRSEQRCRAVVEEQTELIARYRPDGRYLYVNQAFCRFFGKTEDQVVGTNWHPNVFPEDLPLVNKRLGLLSPKNPLVVIENRVVSGTGEVRWMQFVNRGFFDARGRLEETQTVGRDITERKHAEEMLLVYADEVQDLYNHAPCGYHSLDRDGIFVRINDTELGWLGYQRHEIVGIKRFSDLVTAEGAERFRANFTRFKEEGRTYGLEYQMVRKDGSSLPVIVDATAVLDQDGAYLMSRGTVFDNTERKEAEEAHRRYARRLIELEEELRKRIAVELHDDIGQVLTALGLNLAHIDNRLKAGSGGNLQEVLEDSRQLTKEISRSVRSLMVDLRPTQLEEFGLSVAIRSHTEQYAQRTGIRVTVDTDPDCPRLNAKQEVALFRIAQEALSNIMKYAAASQVTISQRCQGDRVCFAIADDGRGFLPGAVSPRPTGSGWGLTIMRERAELIGGSFRVESAPGLGTTVFVELTERAR